jgi:hypothetical protein
MILGRFCWDVGWWAARMLLLGPRLGALVGTPSRRQHSFKQIAKDPDSDLPSLRDLLLPRECKAFIEGDVMVEQTCAACDCKLDDSAIKVTIGGKAIEVCCDECAQKLIKQGASSRQV